MADWSLFALTLLVGIGVVQLDPLKCCLPAQYSLIMTDLKTINTNSISNSDYQMDFTMNLAAIRASTLDPITGTSVIRSRSVFDYSRGKMYYIPENSTLCYIVNITALPTRCIPDDALYVDSSYFGTFPTLTYDTWRFRLPGSNITVTLAVSSDSCVPVVEGTSDPATQTDQILLFTTYVSNIRYPSLFDLPASCGQSDWTDREPNRP
ncbi:hypothetical protein C0Q70_01527 [Pomacea canaliculata]|uniref:ZP domain-containing protein n=1 Tax=Pomacea canaliculata TaxID=400727 RepID=A0A2T7PZR0_POMCA|nr:uncharacterized protein LOC112560825 [Pomacea canaliculata]PVD38902.1 hypothetical protein C0Q70_01527 [Pomacea canaliculata]